MSVAGVTKDTRITRFGRDPLLASELATKNYVDNNAGATTVESLEISASGIITSGVTSATTLVLTADSNGASGDDNLDSVIKSGGGAFDTGTILIVRALNSARTVTIRDQAGTPGQFENAGGGTNALNHTADTATYVSDGTLWQQISFSDNGA